MLRLAWLAAAIPAAAGLAFNFKSEHFPSRARFPMPTSYTPGWHPIALSKNLGRGNVKKVEFADESLAVWRDYQGVVKAHPDACPHLGALLSTGKALRNGCLQCPYHGLCVGDKDSPSSDVSAVGACAERDGIVWWNRFATAADDDTAPRLLTCPDMEEARKKNKPLINFEVELQGSFNDALRNAFDVYHPAFVHSSSFGNQLGTPNDVKEVWLDAETMRMDFEYRSSEKYEKRTGKTTNNHHIFKFPCAVYNVVEAKGKSMLIHIAMRATSPTTTMWYVTSASDFVPHNQILEQAVRRVAEKEDAVQIRNMASDSMKAKYAYRVGLPLDKYTAGITFGVGAVQGMEERLANVIAELNTPNLHGPEETARLLARAWAEATELMHWEEHGWLEATDSLDTLEAANAQTLLHNAALNFKTHEPTTSLDLGDWEHLAELNLPSEENGHEEPMWHISELEAEEMLETAAQRNNIIPSPWAKKENRVAMDGEKNKVEALLYKSDRLAITFSSQQTQPEGGNQSSLNRAKNYKWDVYRKPAAAGV